MRMGRIVVALLAIMTAAYLPQGVRGFATEEPTAPERDKPYLPVKPPLDRISRGNPGVYAIALTFDDGPHAGYTERLLEVLKEERVVSTHFLIGRNVLKFPGLARQIALQGHEVANHSMNHIRADRLNAQELVNEIARASDAIEEDAGVRPVFFRPPGGSTDASLFEISSSLGATVAFWTVSAGDFTSQGREPSAQQIADRVVARAKPGAIIILHDPMEQTLQALPQIVRRLREQGYYFVTMSQMAANPGAVTTLPQPPRSPMPNGVRPVVPSEPSR